MTLPEAFAPTSIALGFIEVHKPPHHCKVEVEGRIINIVIIIVIVIIVVVVVVIVMLLLLLLIYYLSQLMPVVFNFPSKTGYN